MGETTTLAERSVSAEAREILEAATACDMVFIYEPELGNDYRLFPRYQAAGFNFVTCHPAGDNHNIGQAVQRIARMRRHVLDAPDRYVLVDTVDDIEAARAAGKLAIGIHLEGFRCLERDLNMVEVYYALGVRFCHPIFNQLSSIGGGCADRMDVGLSRFGLHVIAEMNRVGMIVDGSHASYRSVMDMLEHSRDPIMMTHQGAHALRPQIRNVHDDEIRGIAEKGGIVGVSGAGFYLGGRPTPELYFRHLDHVVGVGGPQTAALGFDYLDQGAALEEVIRGRPDEWPGADQGMWDPCEFGPPEMLPHIVELMLRHGYPRDAIEGIIGGNFLRLARQVWK